MQFEDECHLVGVLHLKTELAAVGLGKAAREGEPETALVERPRGVVSAEGIQELAQVLRSDPGRAEPQASAAAFRLLSTLQ